MITAQSKVLSISDLCLSHEAQGTRKELVKGITLSVAEKQVMGLIGESGCGKSLTCLAAMGLLPTGIRRTGGEIRFGGQSLERLAPSAMRSLRGGAMAMILQNPMSCFDPVFTISHHFRETLASHGIDGRDRQMERMVGSLAEVGFDSPREVLELYPFQMSGGMLQRVMVALALLTEVTLLIADEPTTDLDVVSQAAILDLLAKLREEYGMSLLLVTHDLGVVARLADEVAVMRSGEIVETGPVKALFEHPRHPYTRSLMQAHTSLYGHHMLQRSAATDARRQGRAAGN